MSYIEVIIALVVVGVVLAVTKLLLPFLVKRGLLPEGLSNLIKSVLKKPISGMDLSEVEKIAENAVAYAEQLYKIAKISKEERNAKAVEFINNVLKESGITANPALQKIFEAMIESAVNRLNK